MEFASSFFNKDKPRQWRHEHKSVAIILRIGWGYQNAPPRRRSEVSRHSCLKLLKRLPVSGENLRTWLKHRFSLSSTTQSTVSMEAFRLSAHLDPIRHTWIKGCDQWPRKLFRWWPRTALHQAP
jgi:hypothetical protein